MSSTSATSKLDYSRQANAFYSLAAAFRQPREWQDEDPSALQQHFGKLGEGLAQCGIELSKEWILAKEDLQACEVAFAKLFLGPFEIKALPYASWYLDPEQKLMGQVSSYVLDAYAHAGLEQVGEVREIPDHIVIELEFMYYLGFQITKTGNASLLSLKDRFWNEHLGVWLPLFAKSIKDANLHPFYDKLASLVERFASDLSEKEGARAGSIGGTNSH